MVTKGLISTFRHEHTDGERPASIDLFDLEAEMRDKEPELFRFMQGMALSSPEYSDPRWRRGFYFGVIATGSVMTRQIEATSLDAALFDIGPYERGIEPGETESS